MPNILIACFAVALFDVSTGMIGANQVIFAGPCDPTINECI